MILYPFKFNPLFKERIWGGQRLREVFGKALPSGINIGESWELADLPEDKSEIINGPLAGQTIDQVIAEYGEAVSDGVINEILSGEISALHIWATTLRRPIIEKPTRQAARGLSVFKRTGCTGCHRPYLMTKRRILTYSFPEIETYPNKNIYFEMLY